MPRAKRSYANITPQAQDEAETVPVRLLKNLVVKITGEATKTEYVFNGAGSIVNVNISDLETIRRKNQAYQTCCGGRSNPYFEIL